jgi:hypothetical protein
VITKDERVRTKDERVRTTMKKRKDVDDSEDDARRYKDIGDTDDRRDERMIVIFLKEDL